MKFWSGGDKSETRHSPFIDVETISSDDEEPQTVTKGKGWQHSGDKLESKFNFLGCGEQSKEDQKVLTLAEQFLAAMPDRIKLESSAEDEEDSSMLDSSMFPDCCSSQSEDLGVESLTDDHSVDFEFNFEEACQR